MGTFNQNITSQTLFEAVDLYGATSNLVRVANGTISVTGTVSQGTAAGTTNRNDASVGGLEIGGANTATELQATGTGSISLTGNTSGATSMIGSSNFSFIQGVEVSGVLSVNSGGITIQGTSGTLNTSNSLATGSNIPDSIGFAIDNGGQITAGNNATISITGTAGPVVTTGAFTGDSLGVVLNSSTTISMGTGGTFGITGFGGAVNAGNGANASDAETDGVDVGGTSLSLATGGSINITGTGGALTTTQADAVTADDIPDSEGVRVHNNADVAASGTTTVTIMGTGSDVTDGSKLLVGGSIGVNIGDNSANSSAISSGSGLIQIYRQRGILSWSWHRGGSSMASMAGPLPSRQPAAALPSWAPAVRVIPATALPSATLFPIMELPSRMMSPS